MKSYGMNVVRGNIKVYAELKSGRILLITTESA